ncbi:D-alanyl-D-alanine carboxypeptidase/D-alanyl-D-alanine-endopeptidase [uncultured Draconibacterium sp.]|uniref:D-alanyl-D-alanine carboxypeptidase/D-alanyl-D-alanine endopeptidase n=1 Tax=uncultured Draconibacterium sp. TaxID=1573823 RepID=UPI00326069EB
MHARYFTFLCLLFFSGKLLAQNSFSVAVDKLLQKQEYKNASVGISIINQSTGSSVYSLNPNRLLIPASTLKLLTSGTALEMLGADYRFKTKISYTGTISSGGTLKGNLLVVAGADPALGSEYFQDHYFDFLKNWAKQVKAAGISNIDGNLVLDGSIYDSERVPSTWIWEDIGNYYGAGANAFSIYDNLFRITFASPRKAGQATKIINTYPKIDGLTIQNEVLSADNNSDNAYVFGGPYDFSRVIRGTIPKNRKAFTIKAAIHQPEIILAQEFLKALRAEGIFVREDIRFEPGDNQKAKLIYIQESPTLSEISEVLNHESINLFAEHFLKQLAVDKTGFGNRIDGIDLEKEFWNKKGLHTEKIYIEDGSGLSHFNAVSPAFFTSFLLYMASNKAFVSSLPVAGEGTLSRFDKSKFPGMTLQAKSGSMTRVRCYSGYLTTANNNSLVFSLMFNHFAGSHSTLITEVESLLHELYLEF